MGKQRNSDIVRRTHRSRLKRSAIDPRRIPESKLCDCKNLRTDQYLF
jgi:hypothetical protein